MDYGALYLIKELSQFIRLFIFSYRKILQVLLCIKKKKKKKVIDTVLIISRL